MTVYEAITDMRRRSAAGEYVAFIFMSYSRDRQTCHGLVEVRKAKIRSRGSEKHNSFASMMEEYLEVDTNEPKHFWHPTLLFYNGQKLTLE